MDLNTEFEPHVILFVIPSRREAKARNLLSACNGKQQAPPFGRNDKTIGGLTK
jgi:hypothetical protein